MFYQLSELWDMFWQLIIFCRRRRSPCPQARNFTRILKKSRSSSAATMKSMIEPLLMSLVVILSTAMFPHCVTAWTGEIRGRVVCDVCGDSSIGPEDHILEGAEVAVLCITKSGEVLNYQAFTDEKGIYTVAETMPESDRWDACLARPISSFSQQCSHLGTATAGFKFTYSRPSGYHHTIRPFVYRPSSTPTYCM